MSTRLLKRLVILAILAVGGYLLYQQFVAPYSLPAGAASALQSGGGVTVTDEDWLTFRPTEGTVKAGLVFYPEARVPPEAYAGFARDVAADGYLVIVPKMPFNFPVLASARASEVIFAHGDVDHWVVGGHGEGGRMAARYVQQNQRVSGLLLVGTAIGSGLSLKNRTLQVTVVYGSADPFAPPATVEEAASRLPETAVLTELGGGNHSQFGSYLPPAGDGEAEISASEQQLATAKAAERLLRAVS